MERFHAGAANFFANLVLRTHAYFPHIGRFINRDCGPRGTHIQVSGILGRLLDALLKKFRLLINILLDSTNMRAIHESIARLPAPKLRRFRTRLVTSQPRNSKIVSTTHRPKIGLFADHLRITLPLVSRSYSSMSSSFELKHAEL